MSAPSDQMLSLKGVCRETQDWSLVRGLHTVKEAVRCYDPVNGQPENIAITKELMRSVRLAHTAYQARLKAGRGRKLNKRRRRPKEYRKQKKRWLNQDSPSKIVQIL